jgi:hypothetical protein
VYTPLTPVPEEGGLWIVERDSSNPQQLVGVDPKLGAPLLTDVSAQGDKALIYYRQRASTDFFSQPNLSYFAMVDLNSGAVEPLKQPTSDAVAFYGPMDAAFSPDGTKILYVYRDASEQILLAVRDLDGGTENVLTTLEKPVAFVGHQFSLTWAEDDRIYIPQLGLSFALGIE